MRPWTDGLRNFRFSSSRMRSVRLDAHGALQPLETFMAQFCSIVQRLLGFRLALQRGH